MNKVYVIELYDDGIYAAYKTIEKAKEVLWQMYCDDIDKEVRDRYLTEDTETFEKHNYITDYGCVDEVVLVEE
jgi:hypothetical protein